MGKLISSSFHSCCSYGDTSVDLFLMHKYHTVSIVVGLLPTLHARNVRINQSDGCLRLAAAAARMVAAQPAE